LLNRFLEICQPFILQAANLGSEKLSDFPKVTRELVIEGAVMRDQVA
jgi:hypothetical protein